MQHGQLRNVPERRRLFGVARVPKRDRGNVRHLHLMRGTPVRGMSRTEPPRLRVDVPPAPHVRKQQIRRDLTTAPAAAPPNSQSLRLKHGWGRYIDNVHDAIVRLDPTGSFLLRPGGHALRGQRKGHGNSHRRAGTRGGTRSVQVRKLPRVGLDKQHTRSIAVRVRNHGLLPTSMRESRCSMAYSHPYS